MYLPAGVLPVVFCGGGGSHPDDNREVGTVPKLNGSLEECLRGSLLAVYLSTFNTDSVPFV